MRNLRFIHAPGGTLWSFFFKSQFTELKIAKMRPSEYHVSPVTITCTGDPAALWQHLVLNGVLYRKFRVYPSMHSVFLLHVSIYIYIYFTYLWYSNYFSQKMEKMPKLWKFVIFELSVILDGVLCGRFLGYPWMDSVFLLRMDIPHIESVRCGVIFVFFFQKKNLWKSFKISDVRT